MNNLEELITTVRSYSSSEAYKQICSLLDILVDETRRDNDTAVDIQLYRNQGAISTLLKLKSMLQDEPVDVDNGTDYN